MSANIEATWSYALSLVIVSGVRHADPDAIASVRPIMHPRRRCAIGTQD